ncbi:MAG: hypothetical protein GY827_08790 [Cytophagales bacterium]|nr:hypothetical protein [Cytophagales bacterium]
MKKTITTLIFTLLFSFLSFSQNYPTCGINMDMRLQKLRIYTQKTGMLLGLQQGKYNFLELGLEHQWKKIKIKKTFTYAVKGNLEYNPFQNVLGYKLGGWTRQGRIALTYGTNFCYFTDFDNEDTGITPAIGLKFLGFHFENGYNIIFGKKTVEDSNSIYISLRYFFTNRRKVKVRK